jgi:hypothetical protein
LRSRRDRVIRRRTAEVLPMTLLARSAAADLRDLPLGDPRRTRRLVRCVEAIEQRPDASFPDVFTDDASLEAFYRLSNNDDVQYDRINAHLAGKTWQAACDAGGLTLVVHDTSEFVVSGEIHRPGLTRVGDRQSFHGHFAIAVAAEGPRVVHGALGFRPYVVRDKTWLHVDGRDGETPLAVGSDRWIELFEQVYAMAPVDDVVHVMDREGDCFRLLAAMDAREASFVVRSNHDRLTVMEDGRTMVVGDKLSAALAAAEVRACREVHVGRRSDHDRPPASRKSHPARDAREAKLSVRFAHVELRQPDDTGLVDAPAVFVTVIDVVELDPPAGEPPIHWRLLTNMKVETAEDALRIVDIYRRRWLIEEFFKAIKTGCAFSKRQANTRATLLRTLAILVPVAVKLLNLRTLADEAPDTSWERVLDDVQFEVLKQAVPKHRLTERSTVLDVMLAIAKLGGHLKSNGAPGWQVLGRGMEKLVAREEGWRAAMAFMLARSSAHGASQ